MQLSEKCIGKIRSATVLLIISMLCSMMIPQLGINSFADTTEGRNVKVGVYTLGKFVSENENGELTGYAIDYMDEIAKSAGWNCEYVMCANYIETESKFENGDIDIMVPVLKNEKRVESMYFPDYSAGTSVGSLLVRSDDDRYFLDDYDSFQKMKIGMVNKNENSNRFMDFAEKNGINITIVLFDTEQECLNALDSKQLDGAVIGELSGVEGYKDVCNYSTNQYYFVANAGDEDLCLELNNAMGHIASENKTFESDTYNKYYGSDMIKRLVSFTKNEYAYISKTNEVTVAFIPNRAPFSYVDSDGKISGITYDVINAISRECGIKFKCVMMEKGVTPMAYLAEHPETVVAGVMTENPAFSKSDYVVSNIFYSDNVGIVCKKGEKYEINAAAGTYKLAIPKSYAALNSYLSTNCPQFEVTYGNTVIECLNMLKDGKVQFVAQNVHVLTPLLSNPHYENFTVLPTFLMDENMGIVSLNNEDGNTLIGIINKCINVIPESEINQYTVDHMVVKGYKTTFGDFVYKFRYALIVGVILLIGIFSILIAYIILKKKHESVVEESNKKLEVAIDKANMASESKGTFLAQMSHEIRTPMNAIIGLTSLAHMDINDPEKMEEYLNKVDGSSKILLGIINDVLDMSAIENHKLKIDKARFDFKELLSSITTIYYQQCKQKGISFELKMINITEEELIGDSLRVNQIILNLLSNAVKFTPAGGRVEVNVTQASKTSDLIHMRFEVSDTGCGMSEDLQNRLFKPFEQEDASTARKHGGSGLGLSISKNMVEMMNGHIAVKSKKDEGTTFTVDIPFGRVDEKEIIDVKHFEDISVLVVDDDAESCRYICELLNRLGIENKYVTDGEAALNELGEADESGKMYNICIVDWKMPKMNGIDVTKQIREIFGDDTVVVIASAYDINEVESEGKAAGANYFIPKPLFQSTLYNILVRITNMKDGGIIATNTTITEYHFSNKRVLIAEDVVLNMEVAVRLLEVVGVKAECAEDGKQAFEMFEKSEPGYYDAILLDINMPVMDGYESARKIRASLHSDAKKITIYAMTANAFSEDVGRCMDAGMNGHIAKPIETQVLYKMLEEAFEKE